MLEFIVHHQFWIAVALYWTLSAAVSALPEPAGNGSPVYLWAYRFSHTIAGNLTTAFSSRIPSLKILGFLVVVPLLMVLPTACAVHLTVHPGALNATDSAAYDALLIAQTTIDQARQDLQAGQIPADQKTAFQAALGTLVRSYNVARASWLTYRGALAANAPSDDYFNQLTTNLSDLTAAIRNFEEVTP